jgi:small subunit ribosomal protein S1
LVVDLGNDLEGFVPQSQLPLAEGKNAEEELQLGQGVAMKVLEVDPIHHRIVLAATDFLAPPEHPIEPLVIPDDDEAGSQDEPAAAAASADASVPTAEDEAD